MRPRRPRVLEHVRQPLLHNPVGREVDARWERPRLAEHRHLDSYSRFSDMIEERVKLIEPRLRCQSVAGILAQHAYESAHLDERLAAGRVDRCQRLSRGRLLALEVVPFVAYLCSQLRHDDASDNWIAATALGAGIVAIAVKLAGVLPAILVEQGDLTPAIAAAFTRLSDVSFMVSMMPLGLFLGAVAAIVVRSRVLPAWLGWSAAVIAPLLVANAFDLGAEFGPAFILFLLWTLTSAIVLLRRAVTAATHNITAPARAVTS